MKQQVARLSPHQNAKVFAVLTAVTSLIFITPIFLLLSVLAPAESRTPVLMIVFMPLLYLALTYLSVIAGCALYNFIYPYVGGIEFEAKSKPA
ncbi:hypothetical protein [Azohydromonas caseinilytica]|uniref:DUF3566 domain-containing protein n=1 Tax=Azohydromonas caseinilytica TaxID=2728836 RepID=A0A848F756_9BURK|nr:hypothetical protein [Azohydromonas caseinilytica]NML15947.1 hypothetical protein [Azohydromonas caseinilytica]